MHTLSTIKDTVIVSGFLGGLLFGAVSLFAPTAFGDAAPTWAMNRCVPVVCDHNDLGASTGNFSTCVDIVVQDRC